MVCTISSLMSWSITCPRTLTLVVCKDTSKILCLSAGRVQRHTGSSVSPTISMVGSPWGKVGARANPDHQPLVSSIHRGVDHHAQVVHPPQMAMEGCGIWGGVVGKGLPTGTPHRPSIPPCHQPRESQPYSSWLDWVGVGGVARVYSLGAAPVGLGEGVWGPSVVTVLGPWQHSWLWPVGPSAGPVGTGGNCRQSPLGLGLCGSLRSYTGSRSHTWAAVVAAVAVVVLGSGRILLAVVSYLGPTAGFAVGAGDYILVSVFHLLFIWYEGLHHFLAFLYSLSKHGREFLGHGWWWTRWNISNGLSYLL